MKKVWKITKIVILSISFFIYAFFILRLCSTGDPKSVTGIVWTDTARTAYLGDPESFEAIRQNQQIMITSDGAFWISAVIYLPQAKELQVTIKYNDSTVKYLKEKLGTEDIPEEPFVYSLLDGDGNRYTDYTYTVERKQNYNYRRLVFENIDLTDVNTMYVDMYYAGAVDYTKSPYGSLMTWNAALPTESIDIQKNLPDDMK